MDASESTPSLSIRQSNFYGFLNGSTTTTLPHPPLYKMGVLEKKGHAYRQQWRLRWYVSYLYMLF